MGAYVTAPSSRTVEPRGLTESAVKLLDEDEDDWEDEDKDGRSERKSVRSEGRRHRRKSEKERSRSRSRDKNGKRRVSIRKDSESSRRKSRTAEEGDERAIPDMGSFEQFPGQYAGGVMGQAGRQEAMMSGALPTPNNQFGLTRADSYGAAAEYYLDEGQSVSHQPGIRASTPNMLVNPDLHLTAPSAEANPAQDTGHGSAADFYSGKVSPVLSAEPQSMISGKPSSSNKPSKQGKTSSLGTAAAAAAAGAGLGAVAGSANSFYQSQNQNSTSHQQSSSSNSRPYTKPTRHNTDPVSSGSNGTYYAPPSQQSLNPGTPGKQSSHSNAGLYAAGAAAAGLAAYEMNQSNQHQSYSSSVSPGGGTAYARPPSYGQQSSAYMNGSMQGRQQRQHFHEHKGPMTRLKDGFFNLISSEEDTIKMEMYTEYIGVCKYCFDPRSSPYDAPRRHHYHDSSRRDSFDDLRKRRSLDKMRRTSREQLGRTGSTRVDKDNRYSDRRKSSSKTDLVGAGLAAAGVAAGANALFNSDRRDFDDTYSVKSGHREGSAVRRRSRSSSREKRRRSSHGIIGRDTGEEFVTVRTKDGRIEKRRVHRSRSRSVEGKTGLIGAAAGAAVGASAVSAGGRSRRSRDHSPSTGFVRRRSRSGSSSGSQRGGIFGGFFSPPRRKRRESRTSRPKKERGFFSFGNDSAVSSDSELAFGASRTDLSLRRKSSTRSTTKRRKSNDNIAATVAGIGATAAALAAAQNGQRIGKRSSRPELGPGRVEKKRQIARKQGKQQASEDDEWEDELPSDVDDASSAGSDLAFGDYERKLSRQQSRESVASQGSGAGGLSAWGWRWGGKDKKRRRDSQRPAYPPRPESSGFDTVAGAAAGAAAVSAVAGAAINSASRPTRGESTFTSTSSVPQQPMQYVDPRPLSEAGSQPDSRHASVPGAFDAPYVVAARPGPAPLQQPKPVTPIKPSFTQDTRDFDSGRPIPRRTQSSPVQGTWGTDAALIGAAAVGTAAVIASQGRKSKDVRFGFTEEQERRHEDERRKEQQRADEERRRADRTRALKDEADRYSREQDVLRQRADENRKAAEAELERQRAAAREAQQQAELQAQRDRERQQREDALKREREERGRREREEARLTEVIERKKRELEEQQRKERRRMSESEKQKSSKASKSSDIPWSAAAVAGAAAAGVGAVALAEHERSKDSDRDSRSAEASRSRDVYTAEEIKPTTSASTDSWHDDAFDDPDYFKRQRSRSPADYARHVDDLARKAADKVKSANKVVKENDAYYAEPAKSQAEFFAPEEILSQRSGSKSEAADPIADNNVRIFNAASDEKRKQFENEWGGTFAKPHKNAPRGVPHLDLITPTPPPEAMSRPRKLSLPSASSHSYEAGNDESGKKTARSRSISWGVDQTHVYDVQTPDSHQERDSYIQSDDVPAGATTAGVAAAAAAAAAAGVGLYEVSKDSESSRDKSSRSAKTKSKKSNQEKDTAVDQDTPPVYQQPFYESVSDIGLFNVDSPGTEGAPPVRGFVEGEVEQPTPAHEKAPHIPGGFNDEDEEQTFDTSKPFSTTETMSNAEGTRNIDGSRKSETPIDDSTSWEAPLSKKDKKKREKAAKRSSTLDSFPTSTSKPEPVVELPKPQPEDDLDYFMMSKKDKKKRDKALKRGISEEQTLTSATSDTSTLNKESTQTRRDAQPVAQEPEQESAWEPQLSKKEKKKREKEAKKQGFADVAETLMTAGGIAAVAGAAGAAAGASDDSPDSKMGKKGKKSRGVERDIRDIEPVQEADLEPGPRSYTVRPYSAMPGGWDSEEKDAQSPSEAVDPFQYQIFDEPEATTTSREVDPAAEFVDVKSKKKSKRDSLKSSEPSASSPLKSEVVVDEGAKDVATATDSASAANAQESTSSSGPRDTAATTAVSARQGPNDAKLKYAVDDRDLGDTRRTMSPDDIRSVASDPTGDRNVRPNGQVDTGSAQYYDEPDSYIDSRSVAASEPNDFYEREKKSKRRSGRDDDDSASVVSSRSRRDRNEPSSNEKEKRSGFFGLFGRKSWDNVPRTDSDALSRQSTRDSKHNGVEDGERKHRRRKHRSTSEYGDDDDTRSVYSESSRKHRSRSERDEESRDRYAQEDQSVRNGDDGHRHHRRRRTDEVDYDSSERNSQRHHHRSRTDDDTNDKDQSFLGTRVEDMPPLPDKARDSQEAALTKPEQGYGSLVSAEPVTHNLSREHAEAFNLVQQKREDAVALPKAESAGSTERDLDSLSRDHADALELVRHAQEEDGERAIRHSDSKLTSNADHRLSWVDEMQDLPSLPDSRPGSPTSLEDELPLRPIGPQRPTSMTAVPLRFPFGNQPPTPTNRMERAASFGGSMPTTPATPSAQKTRQGRPASSEIRPLYLVERNRKTPEVEEILPSLPSSKPSSRASSMIGSDEYESAVEDVDHSGHRRGLSIDTGRANNDWREEDYLDSQQTTPRATHRAEVEFAKPPRQEPQFYTWEDYAQDERLHEQSQDNTAFQSPVASFEPLNSSMEAGRGGEELPALPDSRPESRTERRSSMSRSTDILAATALGGAAVLGYEALKDKDGAASDNLHVRDSSVERNTPLAKANPPVADHPVLEQIDDRPSLSQGSSSKGKSKKSSKKESKKESKKDSKKGKKDQKLSVADPKPVEPESVDRPSLLKQDTESFLVDEAMMEAGQVDQQVTDTDEIRTSHPDELDAFISAERHMEDGTTAVDHPSPQLADAFGNDVAWSSKTTGPVLEEEAFRGMFEPAAGDPPESTAFDFRSADSPDRGGDTQMSNDLDRFVDTEKRLEPGDPGPFEVPQRIEQASEEPTAVPDRTTSDQLGQDAFVADDSTVNEKPYEQPEEFILQPSRKLSKKEKRKQKASKKTSMDEDNNPPTTESSREMDVGPQTTASSTAFDIITKPAALPTLAAVTSHDSMSLSEAVRVPSGESDPTLKSAPSTQASAAEATVHTSMDPTELTASKRLSMNLEDANPTSEEFLTRSNELEPSTFSSAPVEEAVEDKPILQPEDEESWDPFPTLSRKKSKKDKKKQRKENNQKELEISPTEMQGASTPMETSQKDLPTTAEGPVLRDVIQSTEDNTKSDFERAADLKPEDVPLPYEMDMELDPQADSMVHSELASNVETIVPSVRGDDVGMHDQQIFRQDDLVRPAYIAKSQDRDLGPLSGVGTFPEDPAEESMSIDAVARDEFSTANEPVEEFSWTPSSKKKGKKGKKGTKIGLQEESPSVSAEGESSQVTESQSTAEESAAVSNTTKIVDADELWGAFTSKKKKGKKGKKAVWTPPLEVDKAIPMTTSGPADDTVDHEKVDFNVPRREIDVAMQHTDDFRDAKPGLAMEETLAVPSDQGKDTDPSSQITPNPLPEAFRPPEDGRNDLTPPPFSERQVVDNAISDVNSGVIPAEIRRDDGVAVVDEFGPANACADPASELDIAEVADREARDGNDQMILPNQAAISNHRNREMDGDMDTETLDVTPVAEDRSFAEQPVLPDAPDKLDVEDSESLWSPLPDKKRKKKDKKSKKAAAATETTYQIAQGADAVDPTSAIVSQTPSADVTQDGDVLQSHPEDDTERLWTNKPKKGKQSKKAATFDASARDASVSQALVEEIPTDRSNEPSSAEPPSIEPSEPEGAESWAAPVKGRKAKKSKKSRQAAFDWTAAGGPDEIGDSSLNAPESSDIHEDKEWSITGERGTSEVEIHDIPGAFDATESYTDRGLDVPVEIRPEPAAMPQVLLHRIFDDDPRARGLVGDQFSYHDPAIIYPSHTDVDKQATLSEHKEMPGYLATSVDNKRDLTSGSTGDEGSLLPFESQEKDARMLDQDAAMVPLPQNIDLDSLDERKSHDQAAELPLPASDDEQRELDFTADVASGLVDSGFNPADFVQDVAFQRRASPPGMRPEADPEEEFITTTKKKKKQGKKAKKSSSAFGPDPVDDEPSAAIPLPSKSRDIETAPADDFNDTLEKTLAGTGFDAALLQQAMSNSNNVSSNEVTDEPGELSFATSKRKKGKKGEKLQSSFDDVPVLDTDNLPLKEAPDAAGGRDIEGAANDPDFNLTPRAAEDTALAVGTRELDPGSRASSTREQTFSLSEPNRAPAEIGGPSNEAFAVLDETVHDPTSHFAIAGDREMDVDEMDNFYRTMKKNKRSKRKQKSANIGSEVATPIESSGNTTDANQSKEVESAAGDTYGSMSDYFAATGGVAAAAATAAGLSHVVSKKRSGARQQGDATSPAISERSLGLLPTDRQENKSMQPAWSFDNLREGQPTAESPTLDPKTHEVARDSGYQEASHAMVQRRSTGSATQESPVIRTAGSRESLSSRRSADPLYISTDTGYDWDLKTRKTRDPVTEGPSDMLHARNVSRETDNTPLEPTTKNRASYLFQTTPEVVKGVGSPLGSPTPREIEKMGEYFSETAVQGRPDSEITAESRAVNEPERTALSPTPAGTLSPRLGLDTIPEEQQALKRTIGDTDAVPPNNSKAIRRTQTPQAIRAHERAVSATSMPPLTIPAGTTRSASDPLSTDELIHRLPWPAIDDDSGAVNIDRVLPQKHSRQASLDQRSVSVMSNRSNISAGQVRSPEEMRSYSRTSNRSSTPTLRRISLSGDLRAASRRGDAGSAVGARSSPKTIPFEPPPTPPSNDDEVMDGSASRSVNMSDVYVSTDKLSVCPGLADLPHSKALVMRKARRCRRRDPQACVNGKACTSWSSKAD